MKGLTMKGVLLKSRTPGAASPSVVGRGGNVDGITNKGMSHISKTSAAGGFVASRKCGSVKGSHSVGR